MNWVADATAGIKIKADRHDLEDNNLADGLSNCITKDGQTSIAANIPFNGKKITNLGEPTDPTDAAQKKQVDDLKTYTDTYNRRVLVQNIQVTTPSLTVPAGATGVEFEGVGGGGAGAGVGTSTNTQSSAGSGGGSGAYGKTTYLGLNAIGNPTTIAVTIGAGAAGGFGSGAAGSGSAVTCGSFSCVWGGGTGGGGIAPAVPTSTSPGIAVPGGPAGQLTGVPAGGAAGMMSYVNFSQVVSGAGGGTPMGSGGGGLRHTSGGPTASNGNNGDGWGSGGGGAASVNVAHSGRNGGSGANGIVRITWHFDR